MPIKAFLNRFCNIYSIYYTNFNNWHPSLASAINKQSFAIKILLLNCFKDNSPAEQFRVYDLKLCSITLILKNK